jgi:hypothetical protein
MTTYGYLELPYLNDPYLAGVVRHAVKSQVTMVINSQHVVPSQVEGKVSALHIVPSQVEGEIGGNNHLVKSQAEMVINSAHGFYNQAEGVAKGDHFFSSQVLGKILGAGHSFGSEMKAGINVHEHCEDYGYLKQPYLQYRYLDDYICVHQKTQVEAKIGADHPVYSQVEAKIFTGHSFATQALGKIFTDHFVNSQVTFIKAHKFASQVRAVLYNTTNLRILCDFPSRGAASGVGNNAWGNPIATGQNWQASSTMAGDFSVDNVNTDIVEQAWRSNSTVAGVILKCDTEISQGVFLDTFAILGHNLSLSASVQLQGSNSSLFSTIGFSEDLAVIRNHDNIYYIAPELPTTSYRYWRVVITDINNADGYLQIGTIVFGSSIIFQGECFVDSVSKSTKHFSDKVETEGFSNVSNDRALKYAVGLEFRSLRYNRGNYTNIRGVFDYARTSLKCLWIPTPQYPQRFAVFGKLPNIPAEMHNVKGEDLDFVDFSIEVDESL